MYLLFILSYNTYKLYTQYISFIKYIKLLYSCSLYIFFIIFGLYDKNYSLKSNRELNVQNGIFFKF